MWMVDTRREGTGGRTFHPTRAEAEGAAHLAGIKRKNEGTSAFDAGELRKYGWTVQRAIRFALDHLRTAGASVPIEEAVESLIEGKTAAGRGADYISNHLRNNLQRKVAKKFKGQAISTIGKLDLAAYLAELDLAAGTKNTIRTDMVTLWNYAVSVGWAKENQAEKLDVIESDHDNVSVLTPAQAAELMSASSGDIAAYHALGLFAGLRASEIKKIDWGSIKLGEGHIEVTATTAKRTKKRSRSRRIVPITPALRKWLEPVAEKSGQICGPNFRKRLKATREFVGFDLPHNVLRHSFVSYRLADTKNIAATALEAGHTEAILFAHYRELVTPKSASRFFATAPVKVE